MAIASGHWDTLPGWRADPEDTADRDGWFEDPEDLADATLLSARPVGPRVDRRGGTPDVEDAAFDAGRPRVEEYLPF